VNLSVPNFSSLKNQKPPQAQAQKEESPVVGFHVTKEEHAVLQEYANKMYNTIIQNPQSGQKVRVLEKPQIGLLIKVATFYYMQMFNFHQTMQGQQNNPEFQAAMKTIANKLQLG
jgi:hypothetical protein